MKFCIHCGTQMVDEASFCPSCGTKVPTAPAPTAVPAAPPPAAPVYRPAPVAPAPTPVPVETNPVGEYFRRMATSPLALIFAIAFSLLLILNISVALDASYLLASIEDTLDKLEEADILSNFDDYFSAILWLAQIPNILTVIGIWVTIITAFYSRFMRENKGVNLIAGLYKVLRVLLPILFVLMSIVVLSACSKIGDYKSQITRYYSSTSSAVKEINDAQATLAGYCIGMWVMAGFVIFWYGKIVSTLESISYSISRSRAAADISMLVIVMAFISGIGSCISIFNSEGTALWVNLTSAVVQILAACILLGIRDNLARLATLHRAVPSVPTGGWVCSCGRFNGPYVSTCVCGGSRSGSMTTRPVTSRWECKNCYASNPPAATVCVKCGMRKNDTARISAPLTGGNWRCTCGRVNASFVSTCTCGRSKY